MALTPAQLTALATEINTDPAALGYAALKAAGNDSGLANALNLVRAGVPFQISREPISSQLFLANCKPSEVGALTQVQLAQLQLLMTPLTIDINDASTKAMLVALFPANGGGTTQANITALLKRQGSRAEVLFGAGLIVSSNDIAASLGRV